VSFTCPKCGSPYFRSTIVEGVATVGHCKGRLLEYGMYEPCDFSWKRPKDDATVFDNEEQQEGDHADD
jgi:hypothetical protein